MNLLSVLLKVMLADTAISALSGKTGISGAQLKKLMPLAIPLLLRYLTKNASNQSGAQSLLGALAQHTSQRSVDAQFGEADEEDGGKIIRHILGDETGEAVESLAAQTGMSGEDVSRALGGMAPALLSALSAATSTAQAQPQTASVDLSDGLDLSDLMAMLGGTSAAPQPVQQVKPSSGGLLGSLFSSLFGGGQQPVQQPVQQPAADAGGLLSALLGVQPSAQANVQPLQLNNQTSASSLLGSLLSGSVTENDSAVNGTALMSLLMNALK